MTAPLLLLAIFILLIVWLSERSQFQRQKKSLNEEQRRLLDQLKARSVSLVQAEQRVQQLRKYEVIEHAEAEARRMKIAAEAAAQRIVITAETEAKKLRDALEQEALLARASLKTEIAQQKAEIAELKAQAAARKARIEHDYNAAIVKAADAAKAVVDAAKQRSLEIGTYTVLQAQDMQQALTAIENRINGYGDRYLKSSYSIMDDLAEEFGYKDAGEKLKAARDVTRALIVNSRAAACDYVEQERKNTAMNFVLDAFNGKVEVVLSRVKKDNYGTLEQEIRDAFHIVNTLGRAFRNAAVTQEYLHARLAELKWAAVIQQLRLEDAEEQRRIREQMREEEKARKEYERAMKEAQKEEETLKKLIEKAQREVQSATDLQRARYEDKLRELEGRLQQAEEKNQRALSMAQQTRAGNVYIISNVGSFGEEVFKIGMTRRLDPLDRVRELGDASVPFEFDVHAMIYSDDAPKLERELHKKFLRAQLNKVNPRKEFFRLDLSSIRKEVEGIGIQASWTMAAEARQFRETQELEKELARDNAKRAQWERQQMAEERRGELQEVAGSTYLLEGE
jgi:hypothetical protein